MIKKIHVNLVRDLRIKTGVGIIECKKALVAANGNIDMAIEILRKSGKTKAVKKGNCITKEGLVTISVSPDKLTGIIAEINCETDFVANEQCFKEFCNTVTSTLLLNNKDHNLNKLEEDRLKLIAKVGENINVRRINIVKTDNKNGIIAHYLHGVDPKFSRIGVLVAINSKNIDIAKDIALHIAAMNPEYLSEEQILKTRLSKEKEIITAQALKTNIGKSPEILSRIIDGRMNKFKKEVTLLGQPFVKNPNQTVARLLKSVNTEIIQYTRYEVGEGINNQESNFVNEVMSLIKDKEALNAKKL